MRTFEQLALETLAQGRTINTIFEKHMFALLGTLQRIALPLTAAQIPYELIGGAAVIVQIHQVEPDAVRLTKDVDIMIDRADLERIKDLQEREGFRCRVVFSGGPNPPLRPEHLVIEGFSVAVIPVGDLLKMKLSSYRDIDRVHVRDMNSVGLITPEIENDLPQALRQRLQEIRETE